MKKLCPLCGGPLATEDLQLYTCLNCDELFTSEELEVLANENADDNTTISCSCTI
ncbi:MAG: hypothetical protein GX676_08205 [Bacilli bacterium]|nr:hypothetical protein [Bacilli bacterium]